MGPDTSTWHIAFIAREKIYWWDWVFSWGRFKHIVAFGYNPECDQWVYYDWSLLGTVVLPLDRGVLDKLILHIEDEGGIILSAPPPNFMYCKSFFPIATCVAAIKHLTRVRCWAVTPDQLFCAYKQRGSKRLFETKSSKELADGRDTLSEDSERSGG